MSALGSKARHIVALFDHRYVAIPSVQLIGIVACKF
jgi:hypothetical protein